MTGHRTRKELRDEMLARNNLTEEDIQRLVDEAELGYEPEQIRLLPDPCAICGRHTGLMIEQGGVFACVECHTRENGEDGEPDDA